MRDATVNPEFETPAEGECVYFIRARTTGYIKIGYTKSLADRFRHLQAQSGDHLELLMHANATMAHEKHLHRLFSEAKVYGEWYRPIPVLVEAIDHLRSMLPPKQLEDYDVYKNALY